MSRVNWFRSVRSGRFGTAEDGSLTIFSLFIFLLILMIAGTAVDLVVHERHRTTVQNTLDTAVLAAGSVSNGATTEAEMTAMVIDYVTKAGIDPSIITVDPEITGATSRTVAASASFGSDTIFMGLMGIDELKGAAGGRAEEGQETIEIVLVLDVSGSMSRNGKIEALRPAAKGFVTEVITRLGSDRVAISVVPYNHQVRLDDELRNRINWENTLVNVPGAATLPAGAIANYNTRNPNSRCARFRDADFATTELGAGGDVEASAMFSGLTDGSASAYLQYPNSVSWCSTSYPAVLPYENSESNLHTFIDTLQGDGWTSIDYGMNWGVGMLDDGFRPIVQDMVDNNLLHADMAGHPMDFTEPDVKKVIVLMTDGMNTEHLDLRDTYKAGPSRIWHSATLANGDPFDGYLVEMPSNPPATRWFRPGSPWSNSDNSYVSASALPGDQVQLSYHDVYERFRVRDIGSYFFANDPTARAAHNGARYDTGSYGAADTRVRTICSEARTAGIDIYTIAFQAPTSSETLLRDCAGPTAGRYFDVDTLDIATAFDAIAIELTKLRLTQ